MKKKNEKLGHQSFIDSKIHNFRDFLEKCKYFYGYGDWKLISNFKDFPVEIFWVKQLHFPAFLSWFIRSSNQTVFTFKSKDLLFRYFKNFSRLGIYFLKKKQVKSEIQGRNFENLLRIFFQYG